MSGKNNKYRGKSQSQKKEEPKPAAQPAGSSSSSSSSSSAGGKSGMMVLGLLIGCDDTVKRLMVANRPRDAKGMITTNHFSAFGARDIRIGKIEFGSNELKKTTPNRRIAAIFGIKDKPDGDAADGEKEQPPPPPAVTGDFVITADDGLPMEVDDFLLIEKLATGKLRTVVDCVGTWFMKHEEDVRSWILYQARKMINDPETDDDTKSRLKLMTEAITKDFVAAWFYTSGGKGISGRVDDFPKSWTMHRQAKNVFSIVGPTKQVNEASEAIKAFMEKLIASKDIESWSWFDPESPDTAVIIEEYEDEKKEEEKTQQ